MTTATRPLYPIYLSILRQVAALGEATSRSIVDIDRPASKLSDMVARGWLETPGYTVVPSTKQHKFRVRVYRLTAAGRAALESGMTEDGMAFRVTMNFNGRRQKTVPKPVEGCVHHWLVDSTLLQHHVCTLCKATKDVPFRFGLGVERVGAGKVRASERYAMRKERDA